MDKKENENRVLKEQKVSEIKDKISKSSGMVFAKYQGLTVGEDTELRKKLREEGIEYKVYKNKLTLIAAKEAGITGIDDYFKGPVSIAFSYEDPTAPARVINNFAKDHKVLELKGGVIKGKIYDKKSIELIASIPPREVLLAKLLGSFKAPISKFAYTLSAIKDKKEKESAEQAQN